MVKVVSVRPESLTNGWIKGGVERESLHRRISGRLEGGFQRTVKEKEKEGEVVGCVCWTLVATGVLTSGRSDFEGC